MTARALSLFDDGGDRAFARWGLAALIVLAAHLAIGASYLLFRSTQPAGAPDAPAIIVDLAPMPAAPASPADADPGPEMTEAQPEPEPPVVEPPKPPEIVEPPPPEPTPDPVVAAPEPPPPEAKPVERKPPDPPKPPERKRVEDKKPAPKTTAAPRSSLRQAERPAAPSVGSANAQASVASWRDQVMSKLQRAKRYPGGAESRHEQGVVTLGFSLSRNGGVLSHRIAQSSGNSELDREVMSMVERAAPFPPFPAEMTQSSVQLVVPIRFSLR